VFDQLAYGAKHVPASQFLVHSLYETVPCRGDYGEAKRRYEDKDKPSHVGALLLAHSHLMSIHARKSANVFVT
jgi:hypothetical protein